MTRVVKLTGYLLAVFIALAVTWLRFVDNHRESIATRAILSMPLFLPGHPAITRPAQPVRLLIPSIKVDASIESVGVLPNGDLETPHGKTLG